MADSSGKNFFDGEDFGDAPFRPLIPKYYPADYQEYIRQETESLKAKVGGAKRILEAGVGIGRLITELAPLVGEFVGVDNAQRMLEESRKVAEKFSNVRIENVNLEELSKFFPEKYFDFSLCVWNTLGNVKDEVVVLKELARVTSESIFITTYLKGTLEKRENWYKTVGINIRNIDEKNEIFYSESGLKSKSFSPEDMGKLANMSNLQLAESKIINDVMLWTELRAV
ncbi:class I SAM-dependent methyltransferase [Patescibacteria group bacterium]|nr:MAG: class I SAM-dependent methyltransferase [Patescibacteria group bacterium]